jgi:hypothetical protein
MPGGDPKVKSECLKKWKSNKDGTLCDNFEFLQVGKLNIEIPDKAILEPYIRIRVVEEPTQYMLLGKIGSPTLIGESLQSLGKLLPCCWLEGVSTDKPFKEQTHLIHDRFRRAEETARVREKFQQMTIAELKLMIQSVRYDTDNQNANGREPGKGLALIQQGHEIAQFLDSSGVPLVLREVPKDIRRPLLVKPKNSNMQVVPNFNAPPGEKIRDAGGDGARKICKGKLEHSKTPPFVHDFYYRNVPLMRNQDVLDPNEETIDWNYQPGRVFGFVKCTFKLTDGWSAQLPHDDANADHAADVDEDDVVEQTDEEKLRSSLGIDPALDRYAFTEKLLFQRYKDSERVPARVRVRLYLVKAVCIYGKSSGFADPYISFDIGTSIQVSMRNMAKQGTNTPEFYRVEERDIKLPEDCRLEIKLMDLDTTGVLGDTLIGSTVIDLEDRWHSRQWQTKNKLQNVPTENRSLFTPAYVGVNRGSIEMWVEMIESVQASELKPSDLRRPAAIELEVRFVIWSAADVKCVAGDNEYTNVKIGCKLECKEYMGEYYAKQETDVHFNSTGNAMFNWRIVYPRIKTPTAAAVVEFKLYHYELLGDTAVGSLDLDIKKYIERVQTSLDCVQIGPHDLKFRPVQASSDEGADAKGGDEESKEEEVGSVNVTMYVMTSIEAQGRQAGIGREDPNDDPQLITPIEGRDWGAYLATFGFGWPDFGLWKKLIPVVMAMLLGIILFFAGVIGFRQLGLL